MSTDVHASSRASERLGLPGRVAEQANVEYRRGRFSARHPWLVFAALPVFLLPLLWLAFGSTALGAAWAIDQVVTHGTSHPLWSKLLIATAFFAVVEVPVVLSASLICRAANKAGLGWKWPLLGCLLLSLVAVQVCPRVGAAPDGVHWYASIALPYVDFIIACFQSDYMHGPKVPLTQAIQLSLPLVVAAWFLRRQFKPPRLSARGLSAG